MSLMPVLHGSGGAPGDSLLLPSHNFTNQGFEGTIYSGLRIDADGNLYARQANGGWSQFAAWLLSGTASDMYVSRTIDSGSLDTDAGAGPLQLNTDRDYDVQRSIDGEETAVVSFQLSNDSSGSPVLASRTYTFFVERGAL